MRITRFFLILSMLPLGGCSAWLDPPQSVGDVNAGFRYVAIDPLPVAYARADFSHCTPRVAGGTPDLLDALHDLAARISTQQIDVTASAGVPIVSVGASGNTYEVTQDFIAYDETNLRFEVTDTGAEQGGTARHFRLLAEHDPGTNVVIVPVYVGIGLRLTANVTVLKGNVSLSNLGALSAAATANRVQGSLVAQSLGLSGAKVMAIMPIPGELNSTTVQNAAVAIGSIKALIYDADTAKWPRVVGIHYPFPTIDQKQVNAIVSALAAKPIPWKPCATSGQSN